MNKDVTVTLNIHHYLGDGLEVYDREGKKAGQVADYEPVTGYMVVRTSPFADKDLIVPLSAVTNVDPRELFVAETKDELHRKYANPPPRSVEVIPRIDRDSGTDDSRTVIRIPSGYDGSPVVLGGAKIGELAGDIAPGFEVYTSDDEFVGRISRYDPADKTLLVVPGNLSGTNMEIPLALVETVNRYTSTVSLAVSAADLHRFQRVPNAVVTIGGSDVTERGPQRPRSAG